MFLQGRAVRVEVGGGPGNFVRQSNLYGHSAVRFSQLTGLASSPDNPVDIRGDAALTVSVVMNLSRFDGQPPGSYRNRSSQP